MVGVVDNRFNLDTTVQDLVDQNIERSIFFFVSQDLGLHYFPLLIWMHITVSSCGLIRDH